jgi:hypothetical protein
MGMVLSVGGAHTVRFFWQLLDFILQNTKALFEILEKI